MSEIQHTERTSDFFHHVLNEAQDAVFCVNDRWKIIWINPVAARMFNYRNGDLLGRPVVALFPDFLKKFVNGHFKTKPYDTMQTIPETIFMETRCITGDGQTFDAEISLKIQDNSDSDKDFHVFVVRNISHRRKIEAQSFYSNNLFQNIFNAIPDPAYVWSSTDSGQIILEKFNTAALKLTRHKLWAYLFIPLEELYPPDDPIHRIIVDVMNTGKQVRKTMLYTFRSTGESRWLSVYFCRIDEHSVLVVTKDIHARKLAQLALERSEHRLRKVFESSPDAHIITNAEGVIDLANTSAVQIFRCEDMADLLQRRITDFFPKTKSRELVELIRENTILNYQCKGEKVDGTIFPALVSGSAIEIDGKGYFHWEIKDVSQSESLRRSYREIQSQHHYIMENMEEGILFFDKSYKCTMANRAALSYLDVSKEVLYGDTIENIQAGKTAGTFLFKLRRFLKRRMTQPEVLDVRNKEGTRYFEVRAYEVDKGIICHIRDITLNKMLDAERKQLIRMQTIEKIAGQIAHDFNNLLNPLTILPDIIKRHIPEREVKAAHLLDIVKKAGEQMATINKQLISFSKCGNLDMSSVSVNALIQMLLSMMSLPGTVDIEMDLTPDVLKIKGDESQLSRVFMNLIANAVEAMNSSGKLRVRSENISLREQEYLSIPAGDYVRVTISDTGPGIPPDIASDIFKPFFTTKKESSHYGLGLGLNVVREIVAAHDGHVRFQNNSDAGTTFEVYFPVYRELAREIRNLAPEIRGNEFILLIDDNLICLETINVMLQDLGYHTCAATNAQEALAEMKKTPFDIVLMDIFPTGETGLDLIREIRNINPHQKIAIVTAYSGLDQIPGTYKRYIESIIMKPVQYQKLGKTLRAILS